MKKAAEETEKQKGECDGRKRRGWSAAGDAALWPEAEIMEDESDEFI